MDCVSCKNEFDTSILIDSGTESISESPLAEDHDEQSKNNEECPIGKKSILGTSLIDKSFSIEEDDLCTPLEPTPVTLYQLTPSPSSSDRTSDSSEDDGIQDIIHIEVERDAEQLVKENENNVNQFDPSERTDKDINNLTQPTTEVIKEKNNSTPELITILEKVTSKRLKLLEEEEINENNNLETTDTILKDEDVESNIPDTPKASILRKSSCLDESCESDMSPNRRHVFFPCDNTVLVSYKEPENCYPWTINQYLEYFRYIFLVGQYYSSDIILQIYESSCKKNKTVEIDAIKAQIQEIKNNMNHSATLKLSSINITSDVNETLEDILKVANFHTLILQECKFTPETITEFLNILEYYKSVCHFEIAMNFEDDDTWKCFCNACSNIMVLESLSFKGMVISEPYMRHLMSAIKNNSSITTLKFDGCMLVKLPNFYLVESLMTNRTIRELYLPSTGLYTKEADALQRFLVNNTHLKVLDISNNNLGDRGLEVLAKGLCNQGGPDVGLSVLVIFNNQLTEKSGPVIKNIITDCKNLHTLNIGYNNLTDEVLSHISKGLPFTQSLEGLGLQCTLLTCKGILALAEAIPKNQSLQKINLKGNKAIQFQGIETLCNALTNSKISKIEIDETNRSCSDPEAYSQLVKKLNGICTINKNYQNEDEEDDEILNISQRISRKVSLSCEPKYAVPDPTRTFQVGSPVPSPAPSLAPKSRFQIVKVPENGINKPPSTIKPKKSRFSVTRVLPSPDEEMSFGRFANVRGSVSSNDSIDSLTTLPLDSDSE